MKCPHCGQEHPDNTKYCPNTGKKIEFELLSCPNPECDNFGKHILPKNSKFCPDCGTKLNVENEQADELHCSSHTSQHDSDDDFIDLGLSVKWAKCNLGAKFPEEYGNYYAWGETEPKDEYTADNSRVYGKRMSCIAGNPKYDAATAALGQGVRLPTKEEIEELVDKCSSERTTYNGVYGRLVTGPNGNSMFLPAAGGREEKFVSNEGEVGTYWSSAPDEDSDNSDNHAYCLLFYRVYFELSGYWYRSFGLPIRPVREIKS